MNAAILYGKDDIRYEQYPEPVLLPGHVKIKVMACGICGSDIPRVLKGSVHFFPIVLGHEFSGEIVEVAQDVEGLKPGDRVSAAPLLPCMKCDDCQMGNYSLCKHYSFIGSREQGGFCDYVVIPAQNAVKFDPQIPYEIGAMFEPATVALHGILCNRFEGGSDVLILGGGTIGIFAAQWAKLLGSRSVTVADISQERLELAKELGVDFVINTQTQEIASKYPYVFETAGQTATMHLAFSAAQNKARVCFIGTPHAELCFTPAQWEALNRKEFTLTGSWMSYSQPFPGKEWRMCADYLGRDLLKIHPSMIFRTMSMDQASQAFALYKEPSQVKGKILLVNKD